MATEKRLIALDEAIARIKDDGLLGSGYSDDERMDDVIDMLESCHVVDAVEVVHGRWIEKIDVVASYLAECEELFYECSVCNSPNFGESPYCPNCGAKMDGDGNG